MFRRVVETACAQALRWKQLLCARFAILVRPSSKMDPDSRSSTPSFYDRSHPDQSRPLPPIPEEKRHQAPVIPPLRHRPLLAGSVAPDPDRKPRRPLSWSEAQINSLQKQNKDLRQEIISQKRQALEKERIIATQKQQISKYIQKESKQDDMLKMFANNVHVALEDLRDKRLWSSNSAHEASMDAIDDVITVYREL